MITALLLPLLTYALFLVWYGGRGRPLVEKEINDFLALITSRGIDREDPELFEALKRLLSRDDGREFVMVNLIKYREKAAYPPGSPYGDNAIEADKRYARAFFPHLLRYGNVPVFISRRSGSFIEPQRAEPWQVVAMIRYRSRRDFIRSVRAVVGKDVMIHKWAAIDTTHVFPVRPLFSFIAVRWAVAVLIAVVASFAYSFAVAG
ncbi:MAG: hypothetical protein FJ173_08095 [Gammaproteobacteria bacterium]|nr:hypothetical protein [Gammaproteobacteria bacterium]